MTPAQQAEVIELQRQMHEYLNTLVASGMDEATVSTAALVAASERVLMASTPTQAAAWLRGQALAIEKFGPAMIEARKRG